jgi:Caspase domain
MRRAWSLPLAAALLLWSTGIARARPDGAEPQLFALLIGANRAVASDLPPLRYADDDAARYLELFDNLGAEIALLADLDDNSRRLHPKAAATALPATLAALAAALDRLAAQMAEARRAGRRTILYVVFAGHGKAVAGQGQLALRDGWISGDMLARDVIGRLRPDVGHVVVDACDSLLLAYQRGPGGSRRPARGFAAGPLARLDNVGLLLSSTTTRESHEWEAFQSGVFSHEVRSGLQGPADADGDGAVSYLEIAAFVDRANESIPNERFRPHVLARAPARGDTLLDLGRGAGPWLEIEPGLHGHYILDDELGVRVAEFHSSPAQAVRLRLRAGMRVAYLRRRGSDREYTLRPSGLGSVRLATLKSSTPRVAARGAASEAFGRIFDLPFDGAVVERFRGRAAPLDLIPADDQAGGRGSWRRPVGWGAVGVGAGLAVGSLAAALSARGIAPDRTDSLDQREAASINAKIEGRNRLATGLGLAAAGVAAAGVVLLLWPDAPPVVVEPAAGGASLGATWAF